MLGEWLCGEGGVSDGNGTGLVSVVGVVTPT